MKESSRYAENMKLKALLKVLDHSDVRGSKEIQVSSLTSHSQSVAPGSLFIAKKGNKFDGNLFSQDAVLSGAVAVVSDIYNPVLKNVTQILVKDVPAAESKLAAQFYGWPSSDLLMIGITGTSGKTTTSYLARHLLIELGTPSGLIGTVSYIAGANQISASRTTPDVIFNQKLLHDMVKAGDKACVMEVTSHALHQGRVENIDFDVAIFTNLSHEHLDYHSSMDEYAKVKGLLFKHLKKGKKKEGVWAVINRQDPYYKILIEECEAPCLTYGIEDDEADLSAYDINLSNMSSSFTLRYKNESIPVEWNMAGRFNVANALAAIGALITQGYELSRIVKALKTFQGPPGRLERVNNPLNLAIFVDYAHKEDALRKVLPTLRECTKGKIITVFGCGGDRDREKRPKMARAVEELSDIAIVTSDNPRSEDPNAIIQEVCSGFQKKDHRIESDRKKAIQLAVSLAGKDDTILIAGKGHEKEQIFAHTTIPFDDCLVARMACEERFKGTHK